MKNLYLFILVCLFSFQSNAQSQFYSVPVTVVDTYLEDSIHVVGRLDLDFPVDGNVFVQFDGEGYGSPNDRIIVAANNYPEWGTNDGNVNFMSSIPGEKHCFSHTRTFPVTAGHHSFYAVAHNYVDIEGEGIATIYGTLSVEFVPIESEVKVASSIKVGDFDATTPVAFDSITVEATGAGKIEVRLNGAADCNPGDVIVVAVTDTKNWNYSDPGGIALETNISFYPYVTLSTTRVFDVPGAGTYKYYAMVQRGYEEEGNGHFYNYAHLHARYYPTTSTNVLKSKVVAHENLNLTVALSILDSLRLDVTSPGKVEVRFDGALKSPIGQSILLAANNQPSYELEEGSVILQTIDNDVDRHPFVHTQVFDVVPGANTFYVMAQNYLGSGPTTVDLDGNFLVKFYPESVVSSNDGHFAELPFEVWPNPTTDRIRIQYQDTNEPINVSIIDLQGHLVQQKKNLVSGSELEISTLASGIYIVQISNGKEIGYKKLVKE